MELPINPLFNVHDKYKEMHIINPYRFGGGNGLLTNLVSGWEFEETSGSTAFDAHGSNDGTINGETINQTGKVGQCYFFDGDNDYVSLGNSSSLKPGSGAMSWSFWFDPTTFTNRPDFISDRVLGALGAVEGYVIGASGSNYGEIQFAVEGSDNNYYTVTYQNFYSSSDSWIHVVIAWDGQTGTFNAYKNGTDVTSSFTDVLSPTWVNGTSDCSNTTAVQISNRPGAVDRYWEGYIDQVFIWNTALTSDQVTALYNSGDGLAYSEFTT